MDNTTPCPRRDVSFMNTVVDSLFPTHPVLKKRKINQKNVPLFTVEELKISLMQMKNKKAPGPDRIPTEVLKLLAEEHSDLLLNMFNGS